MTGTHCGSGSVSKAWMAPLSARKDRAEVPVPAPMPETPVRMIAEPERKLREMIKALNPDVVTLDVEMPRMDGLSFLEKIMTLRPMPVIMVSSLTQANADITINAPEIGAGDFLAQPSNHTPPSLEPLAGELCEKV